MCALVGVVALSADSSGRELKTKDDCHPLPARMPCYFYPILDPVDEYKYKTARLFTIINQIVSIEEWIIILISGCPKIMHARYINTTYRERQSRQHFCYSHEYISHQQ